MSIHISVDGAFKLRDLSKRLKAAGRGDLRKRLRKGIANAARPVVADVRAAAVRIPAVAPDGTLRRDIAKAIVLRNRQSGVTIAVRTSRLGSKAALPRLFERQTFRHRVFGRDVWVNQRGHPWFAPTTARAAPALRAAVVAEIDAVARELEG